MRRIGIEELIALNNEILALSRAGIPLGRGLLDMGADMPRQLQSAAKTIGTRLEQGEDLESILADEDSRLPRIYSAVVAAGVQSGHLPVALEKLSSTLARLVELRSVVTLASIYPLFLVMLASALFTFVAVPSLTSIQNTLVSERISMPTWLSAVIGFGIAAGPYVVYCGLTVVGLCVVWLLVSRRSVMGRIWLSRFLGWLPGLNRMLSTGRVAAFLETLRLLVSQRIPLDRAITLAAAATGDEVLIGEAGLIADDLRHGKGGRWKAEGGMKTSPKTRSIPPLVYWLLTTQQTHDSLSAALNTLSESYTARTQRTEELLRTFLPIWLTLAVGGSVTILYIASIAIPWMTMLRQLAE